MKLILVRHTKVDVPRAMCYGVSNVALHKNFEKVKNKIKRKLSIYSFDRIYSSPLDRCKFLAEHISNGKQEVVYDNRLLELNFGDWEGKTWNEIEQLEESKAWFSDYVNVRVPGGESFTDLLSRTSHFLDAIKDKKYQQVLVVCHSGTIRAFYTLIKNLDAKNAFDFKPQFGGITELDFQ